MGLVDARESPCLAMPRLESQACPGLWVRCWPKVTNVVGDDFHPSRFRARLGFTVLMRAVGIGVAFLRPRPNARRETHG